MRERSALECIACIALLCPQRSLSRRHDWSLRLYGRSGAGWMRVCMITAVAFVRRGMRARSFIVSARAMRMDGRGHAARAIRVCCGLCGVK